MAALMALCFDLSRFGGVGYFTPFNGQKRELRETMSQSEAKHTGRFTDGFGSISAVAAVLAEVICGMSLVEAQQEDKVSLEGLGESDKVEAKRFESVWRKYPDLRPSTHESRFGDKQRELTTALLAIAAKEGWIITDSDGVLQVPPRAFGVLDVVLVRDWFGQSRGHNHLAFARALTQALDDQGHHLASRHDDPVAPQELPAIGEACLSDTASRPQREGLETSLICRAFAFLPGLNRWLGDTNNHRWVLPARLSKGSRPKPATWCPVQLAKLLLERKHPESELNEAFLNDPALRKWRSEWQEERRERNAFGQ